MLRQEDFKFKTRLSYTVRLCLKDSTYIDTHTLAHTHTILTLVVCPDDLGYGHTLRLVLYKVMGGPIQT